MRGSLPESPINCKTLHHRVAEDYLDAAIQVRPEERVHLGQDGVELLIKFSRNSSLRHQRARKKIIQHTI